MGYLFISLSLAFGLVKAFCGKKASAYISSGYDAFVITALRMVVCALIGALLSLIGAGGIMPSDSTLLLYALCAAVSTAGFTVCWMLAVRGMAYMVVEIFVMIGVLIPLIFSNAVYGELITPLDILGIALLLAAAYCISTYQSKISHLLTARDIILLLLCTLFAGTSDLSQKIFVKEQPDGDIMHFNFYTFLFAAILLCVAIISFCAKSLSRPNKGSLLSVIRPVWVYVLVMAVSLFLCSYFKTSAAIHLDAVVLYPVSQSLATTLSFVMSILFFKERANAKGVVGVVLSIIGIVLINI